LQNVRFDTVERDLRPAIVFDQVKDAALDNLSVQGDKDAESAMRFINTQDVLVTGARLLTPAKVFLAVEGTNGSSIKLNGGDISKAGKAVIVARGAKRKMVEVQD